MFFIPADDNIRSYWCILGTSNWAEQRTRSSTLFTLHKKTPGRGNSVRRKSHLREKCSLSNTSDNYPRSKHRQRTCSIFLPHFLSQLLIPCRSQRDFYTRFKTGVLQGVLYLGHIIRDGLKHSVVIKTLKCQMPKKSFTISYLLHFHSISSESLRLAFP